MRDGCCDVCAASPVPLSVRCSGMGPISFAYCEECAAKPVEPEWVFRMTYDDCGENVAEWVKGMWTFKDGAYVQWPDWLAAAREAGDAQ